MSKNTPEDEVPFNEHIKLLNEEELLNLWEQTQKFVTAIQAAVFPPDVQMKSNVEDTLIAEMLRRDTVRRQNASAAAVAVPSRKGNLPHPDKLAC